MAREDTAAALGQAALELATPEADRALDELAAGARFVLLGEASHGTHDFYAERARITRRLIERHGFSAVAVEADWPDAHRVNCFVQGAGDDPGAEHALRDFRRFPTWMWRNADVVELVAWLRDHNATRAAGERAGFHGMDLYSLHASMRAVIAHLQDVDPDAAERARRRYACFELAGGGERGQDYGLAVEVGDAEPCEDEVVEQLVELRRRAADGAARDARVPSDAAFAAEQNARLVANAERYYRCMFRGRAASWNLRDRHMAGTLEALAERDGPDGRPAKIVVWAHNSHLGDARATEMGRHHGELNVGQLVREAHGRDALLVGFTTHDGTVVAADDWDGAGRTMTVRPALPGSVERLLHDAGVDRGLVVLRDRGDVAGALAEPLLERAIGVIYRPQTERASHYFEARVGEQFDALIHLDRTRALEPLAPAALDHDAVPETYPSGV